MKRVPAIGIVLVILAGLLVPGLLSPAHSAPKVRWHESVPATLLSQFEDKGSARYLVLLKDRADLTAPAAIPDKDSRRQAIVQVLRTTAQRSQSDLLSLLQGARTTGAVSWFESYWVVNAIGVESTRVIYDALSSRPEVRAIVADHRRHLITSTPGQVRTATLAATQGASPEWNIERVGAPQAWDAGIDGAGAVVASIDTGVDWQHPSLAANYRGADGNHDYDWWDAVSHKPVPYDNGFHGTHTMGTLAGGDGNGPGANDIGVAPGATWITAKAFSGGGYGYDTWILEAAQFLTAPTKLDGTDPRPELAPDVVSNSWGGGPCDSFFDDVLSTWRDLDIFPAFAIGNSGPDEGSASAPGDSPDAVGVGATDDQNEVAFFSSRGPSCHDEIKPEVSAPGVDVRSSVPGGFDTYSGTSMATPHVAGAVALLEEASAGTITVDEAEQVIQDTALDLGSPGIDNDYGAGLLQAYQAVQIVLKGGTLQGSVSDPGGAPLAGVEISAEGPDAGTTHTFSRDDGTFRIRLVEGVYQVTAGKFGYLTATGSATILKDQVTTLGITLQPAPTARISGTITDSPASDPVAGASVTVLGTPLDPATTDGAGHYAIDVPIGTYDVEASGGGCLDTARTTVALSGDVTQDFALERILDNYGYVCDPAPFADEPGVDRLSLTGDDREAQVSLPFPFRFYGSDYTDAYVSTNGFVSFYPMFPEYVNTPIPNPDPPNAAIYALWDDLWVGGSERGVYTATYGQAPNRRFVIEYRNFELLYSGDLVNFSVVLNEDGTFETRYGRLEGRGDGRDATIGVENPGGTSGLQYGFDEPILADHSAIRYRLAPAGFLEGSVTSGADGLPVEGATVSLGDRSVVTLSGATYRLAAWPGTYPAQAAAPGYETQGLTVTLGPGEVVQNNFVLPAPRLDVTPKALSFDAGDGPLSADLSLQSQGQNAVTYQTSERNTHPDPVLTIDDPQADADGSVDITQVGTATGERKARFRISFSDSTPMDEVVGLIYLDTDQDASTGYPPSQDWGKPEQDIGYDYVLDVFSLPRVYVFDKDWNYHGKTMGSIDGQSFAFDVPLSFLGEDDGRIDLDMVLGDWDGPTDWAPDAGHGTIDVPPVPWLDVQPSSGSIDAGNVQAVSVSVDPAGLDPGMHHASVFVSSNDPRRPVRKVSVALFVPDTAAPTTAFTTQNGAVLIAPLGQRVQGTVTDNFSGPAKVDVTYTSLAGQATSVVAQLVCGQDPLHCTWSADLPQLPGRYTVVARATDHEGNQEAPGPTITVVDV